MSSVASVDLSHTHVFSSSSIMPKLQYGKALRMMPLKTAPPPLAKAHAARTCDATVLAGRPWPKKMTRFPVEIALNSKINGGVRLPLE